MTDGDHKQALGSSSRMTAKRLLEYRAWQLLALPVKAARDDLKMPGVVVYGFEAASPLAASVEAWYANKLFSRNARTYGLRTLAEPVEQRGESACRGRVD
jgi:hypothetical protein